MPRNLDNTSDIAEEKQNIAGQKSPILSIQPEDGRGLIIKGMVARGSEQGFPLYGSFVDQNGDPINPNSELSLTFEAPGDDDPTTVTHPITNLRPYESLDVDMQQDEEKVDAVKHVIKGTEQALDQGNMPKIGVGHLDWLHVNLESEDVVDWSHPDTRLSFDRNAVKDV